jgi:hypothetical protein
MMRRAGLLGLFVLALALLVGLGLLLWNAVGDVSMSGHGWIAMVLGAVLTVLLGVGLMSLVFYSHRKGYDEIDRGR